MKKLLLKFGLVMAIIILTACDRNLDAFELLELAHEVQEQADVVSMTMDLDTQVSMSGDDHSRDSPITIRFEVESEERMRMDISMLAVMMDDEEINMILFERDGYEYAEINGQRTRTALDTDDFVMTDLIDGMFGADFIDNFTYIDEDWVETSSIERTDDDGYRLEFIFNIERLSAFYAGIDFGIPGMNVFLGDLSDFDEEQKNWGMVMTAYLDEDYLFTSATVTAEFSAVEALAFTDIDGIDQELEVAIEIEMILAKSFEDVVIDFPDWLDEIGNVIPRSEADLVGVWEWNFDDRFQLVFNEDGTGEWVGFNHEFTWEVSGDEIVMNVVGGIGDPRRWRFEINDRELTITNLVEPGMVYTYIRR